MLIMTNRYEGVTRVVVFNENKLTLASIRQGRTRAFGRGPRLRVDLARHRGVHTSHRPARAVHRGTSRGPGPQISHSSFSLYATIESTW